jgi:hypothetical protein
VATLRLGLRVVIRPQQNKKHGLAAESRSLRAPGPRPTSPGRPPRVALGGERDQGLCYVSTFYTTLVRKSQEANGHSNI